MTESVEERRRRGRRFETKALCANVLFQFQRFWGLWVIFHSVAQKEWQMISVVLQQLKVKGDMAISEGFGPTITPCPLAQNTGIKTKVEENKTKSFKLGRMNNLLSYSWAVRMVPLAIITWSVLCASGGFRISVAWEESKEITKINKMNPLVTINIHGISHGNTDFCVLSVVLCYGSESGPREILTY